MTTEPPMSHPDELAVRRLRPHGVTGSQGEWRGLAGVGSHAHRGSKTGRLISKINLAAKYT